MTLNATVRNQGTGPSSSTTLHYYRSTDETITTSDTPVGTDSVSGLNASGSSAESITVTAPSDTGTYYYGACVDAVSDETDTTNNCSLAVAVNVGGTPTPDLVVDMPTVSDSSPFTGARFTLMATVRNQGKGQSFGGSLYYYRSTDSTISSADSQFATDIVMRLAGSATSPESVIVTAPSNPGTYYYGACFVPVSEDSNTGNNCSSAVIVTVGEAPAPDLVVDTPTVSKSIPAVGESFTLSAVVRNQGDGSSQATSLYFFRSTIHTMPGDEYHRGTSPVDGLSPSESGDGAVVLTAPSTPFKYFYSACVRSVSNESDTTNDCSDKVTISVVDSAPSDLVVDSPTVSNNNLGIGESFTLNATVRNQGNGRSIYTTLRYYRSTDSTISNGDTELGTYEVSGLSASGSSSDLINLTAPLEAGTYFYGACVDAVAGESDDANNCSDGVAVTVSAVTEPDLVVDTPTVDDSVPRPGREFRLSATVRNRGNGPSDSTTLRYYRSTDSTISSHDTEVGTDSVSGLNGSGTSAEWITLKAPDTLGPHYFGVCADAVVRESDATNNCSSAVVVTVSAPELVVEAPTVSNSNPVAGTFFTFSVTVRNQGNGVAKRALVGYLISTDPTITLSDRLLERDHSIGPLAPSETRSVTTTLTAPSTPGTFYYAACVRPDDTGQIDTTTINCTTSVKVDVSPPPAPDLTVGRPTVSDSDPEAGESFTLNATVRNKGDGNSSSTTLRYYRSTDSTITTSDMEVGTDQVSALSASGSGAESISLTAPSTAGTYYYGACVDSVTEGVGHNQQLLLCGDSDRCDGTRSRSNSYPYAGRQGCHGNDLQLYGKADFARH